MFSLARAGRIGANAFRLRPLLAGRTLAPGTYRLLVRTPHELVLARRFVLAPANRTLRVLGGRAGRDTCRTAGVASAVHLSAPAAAPRAPTAPSIQNTVPRAVSAADFPHRKRPEPFAGRVLSTVFTKQFDQAPGWLRPIMLAFLAAAIVMLGTAALPQRALPDGRVLTILERRRLGLALSGVAVLLAIAIAALLS